MSKTTTKNHQSSLLRSLTRKVRGFDKAFVTPEGGVLKTAAEILRCIDTPKSLACALMLKHREFDQLINVDIDPASYCDPVAFRDDYHAVMLLKKFPHFETEIDRKTVALDKWLITQERMKALNDSFRHTNSHALFKGVHASLISRTCVKIQSVLKDELTAEELFQYGGWGPGVSRTVKGNDTSATNKFHAGRGITRDALDLLFPVMESAYPEWSNLIKGKDLALKTKHFKVFSGNKVSTVPKNSKTDRIIGTEPCINMFFQKSIGSAIRRRLRKVGVDLNDQAKNMRLAKIASVRGHLTTADLQQASDTISCGLVHFLFTSGVAEKKPQPGQVAKPGVDLERWYRLMDVFRSKYALVDGKQVRWQSFSGMGNGFTFELESLIFFAVATAVCEELGLNSSEVSIYGDDIILPTQAYSLFVEFASALGFMVNREKSFSSGYFRESCGAHFFDGLDCRPLYIKDEYGSAKSVYNMANSIRLLAHRRNNYYGCDVRFLDCWKNVVKRVQRPLRIVVDASMGNMGFIGNFDEALPSRAPHQIEGFNVVGIADKAESRVTVQRSLLTARLYELGASDEPCDPYSITRSGAYGALRYLNLADIKNIKLFGNDITSVFGDFQQGKALSYGNKVSLKPSKKPKCTAVVTLVSRWYELGQWI